VFWLAHSLDGVAYSALPAKSVPDAALLVMQLDLKVDVLVINLALAGASSFMAALHRLQKDARVVAILNDRQQAIHSPGVNALHPKPSILNEADRAEWVQCIERVLINGSIQGALI
jgi:hypothetical protein